MEVQRSRQYLTVCTFHTNMEHCGSESGTVLYEDTTTVIHFENTSGARKETKMDHSKHEGFVTSCCEGGGGVFKRVGLALKCIMCGNYRTHFKTLLVAYPAVVCSWRLGGFTYGNKINKTIT